MSVDAVTGEVTEDLSRCGAAIGGALVTAVWLAIKQSP